MYVLIVFQGHRSTVTGLFVLSSGFRVLSADEDGLIQMWRAEDGVSLLNLEGPTHILEVTPNSHLAVSGDADATSVLSYSVCK